MRNPMVVNGSNFIIKLAIYSKGLAYNYRLYYFIDGELHFNDIITQPSHSADKTQYFLICDNKLFYFINTTKDLKDSINFKLKKFCAYEK